MRSIVSRILLLGLVLTIGVVAVRALDGSDALIDIQDEGPDELEHETFEVTRSARLAVDARGSIESTSSDTTVLAVTAWIVRRSDGAVVWEMPARRPERGTYLAVRDTVTLAPGLYEAYLSSYGDPAVRVVESGTSLGGRIRSALSGSGRAWHGDAGRWGLALDVLGGAARRVRGDDPGDEREPDQLWTAWNVRSSSREATRFRVGAPSEIRVSAVGEISEGVVRDSAYVLRLPARDTVWVFRDGVRAGGADLNRSAEATLPLDVGLYEAVYVTDRSHATRDWTATPPYAPWRWGLEIRRPPGADVALFGLDAVRDLPAIAEFACVERNQRVEDTFTLQRSTDVVLYGVGEIGGDDYDWGELVRVTSAPGSGETVWRMTDANTSHAGGASRNRQGSAIRSLAAGTYSLRYVTDEAHDCGDWSSSAPDDESFWGIGVYALDPDFDLATVAHASGPVADDPEPAGDAPGEVLARLDRLGNDVDVSARFRLDAPATVRVVALGELRRSERLDYGWIEDASGRTVWEMTREDTEPAGGTSKNRRADATLRVGEGEYTVHFTTNGRHAYDAFDGAPPDRPEDWGIRVERVADADAPGFDDAEDAEGAELDDEDVQERPESAAAAVSDPAL